MIRWPDGDLRVGAEICATEADVRAAGKLTNLRLKSIIRADATQDERQEIQMQTLNQDIKNGSFRPVYLLYGDETFLAVSYTHLMVVCSVRFISSWIAFSFSRFF